MGADVGVATPVAEIVVATAVAFAAAESPEGWPVVPAILW